MARSTIVRLYNGTNTTPPPSSDRGTTWKPSKKQGTKRKPVKKTQRR